MYLKSSEIIKSNGKEYLQIFLNKEYPYSRTIETREGIASEDRYEIWLEEPNALDYRDLQRCSIILERFFNYKIQQETREYAMKGEEEWELLEWKKQKMKESNPEPKKEAEPTEEERIDNRKQMLSIILTMCKTMRNDNILSEETDYYLELAKLFSFINKKLNIVESDLPFRASLDIFDKYKGKSYGIKEQILIEYISFFFAHFPSNSILHILEQ